jgi:hypothetical protein
MENKKKLPGAEIFGIKVIIDPSMKKSDVLYPEKLARAKEMISKIEWPPALERFNKPSSDK